MKITTSTVEKFTITDIPGIDVIHVFFEDYGPERGKVTIEVCGDAWSYFWGKTGCETIKDFFKRARTSYLVGKFDIGIRERLDDESGEALELAAKKFIISERRQGNISRYIARENWNTADTLGDGIMDQSGELQEIFGDEWYNDLPQKPNPKYTHLFKIVQTIQEALKQSV